MRTKHLAAAIVAATTFAVGGTAFATADVTVTRLDGANRYGTAAAIADGTFPDAPIAMVATGETFPDALAAAYVAGANPGPIVLTPKGGVAQQTLDGLAAVGAQGVIIVGGNEAVSPNVATQLTNAGYQVDRIFGTDRYDTAAQLARALPPEAIGELGNEGRTAIIASGENYPDALAAGPVSYWAGFPILLTQQGALPASTSSTLDDLGIENAIVLGGEAAVGTAVTTQLTTAGISWDRIGGANRMETATLLADWALDNLGWNATHVNLARGDNFADALAGGPNGGEEEAPILLTGNANDLSTATHDWLDDNKAAVRSIHLYGGTAAISNATAEAARTAAGGS